MIGHRVVRLLLTALIACLGGGPAAAQVKIDVWHSLPAGAATTVFNDIVKAFQQERPDITVAAVNIGGYGTALQKAQVALAGGAAPHVAMFEQTRNMGFVDSGALVPLNLLPTRPNGMDFQDFHPAMLETVTYGGKIYGIPYNPSTPLLYYNRDLFRQSGLAGTAPRTWNELAAAATKLTRDKNGDGTPDVWGIDFYEWGWLFEAWLGQNGARVLNEDGTRFIFDSEPAVAAMRFVQSLIHEKRVAVALTDGYKLFFNNQLGMTERSTASLQNNIDQATFDMGVAPLACNVACYAPIGGANFVMFNTGTPAERDAAWTFLTYISSPERLARFAAETGYMAARRSSFQSDILQARFAREPRSRVTYEQLDHAHARAKVPFWQQIDNELETIGDVMFKQNGNVRAAMEQSVRKANVLLEQYLQKKAGK